MLDFIKFSKRIKCVKVMHWFDKGKVYNIALNTGQNIVNFVQTTRKN